MGANFDEVVLDGAIPTQELKKAFKEIQDQRSWEYGHSGYTGTFAEADGIEFPKQQVFKDETAAEKWLSDHADKWGPALAVKYTTPNGELKWYIAAWCSS
jgi:hypothetical protein